jgi:hypothetical protein
MPDTGAPWNIPYVENADLVSDWPADSLLVANAVAAGLSAAGNPGIGSNVVQTVKTDTFTSTAASFVDITGMEVTITPSSATSKILLVSLVHYSNAQSSSTNDAGTYFQLTGGNTSTFIGDAASNRTRATTGYMTIGTSTTDRFAVMYSTTIMFLDAPASAAAVTYKTQMLSSRSGQTATLNRSGPDTDNVHTARLVSSMMAIEVAA